MPGIGAIARTNAAFGEGNAFRPIFSLRCNGLEARLLNCVISGGEVSSCSHSQDAGGVVCMAGTYILLNL